jgi:hypothetical protein
MGHPVPVQDSVVAVMTMMAVPWRSGRGGGEHRAEQRADTGKDREGNLVG